jgi:hypothetical protein
MAADPAACTHEAATRYEALSGLIGEEEKRWLHLQDELDALDDQPAPE